MLGWTLEELIENTIEALKTFGAVKESEYKT